MKFDLAMTDELLSTTRAVRKRLDLERPVPREIVMECLQLALQAPTGGNRQSWRWLVIDDAGTRRKLAELYAEGAREYLGDAGRKAAEGGDTQTKRVYDSATYLVDVLHRVPVHVIPCLEGRPPAGTPHAWLAGLYGSIFPAVWSFQLALRSRGLGSALTTLHLLQEQRAAELLGIPADVMQVALLPVGWTTGGDFKRAERPPAATVTHWNHW